MTQTQREHLFWFAVVCVLMFIAAMKANAAEDRDKCTWSISFYALGKRYDAKSDHAWLLTKNEQAQLFGPFTTGSLYVEPGNAWFQCGNNKVNIITAPLPSGSLLLLRDR